MKNSRLLFFFQAHPAGKHLGFWILVYFIFIITALNRDEESLQELLATNAIHLPSFLLAAYSFNYVLIPTFFRKRRYVLFILLFLSSAYLISIFDRFLNVYVSEPLFREGNFSQETASQLFTQTGRLLESYFPKLYMVALAMTLIRISRENVRIREANLKLANERTTSELNFLKAQLHPHFLFNTLNNLYSLAIQKSNKTPDAIARLSEIFDYTLYQNQGMVEIDKEIKAIHNYIELERLRYGDSLKVSFKKKCTDKNIQISPLLFLSIVENAFKHGTGSTANNPEIDIELTVIDKTIKFVVFNTIGSKKQIQLEKRGVGVDNVKRQLSLTYKKYTYDVEESNESYLVNLFIDLNGE